MNNTGNIVAGGSIDMMYIYGYFVLVFFIAFYLIYKSDSHHKIELFFLCFYLMTGNINEFLIFKIPGLSFFEIQPQRFLFLLFSFFLVRHILFSKNKEHLRISWNVPWFLLLLISYVVFKILSQFTHVSQLGFGKVILNSIHTINFLVLFYALKLMAGKETFRLIGNAIMITAVFTTVVSVVQVFIDPSFMRVGDYRSAFGDVYRANGIFGAENFNSFFLITAIAWALIMVNKKQIKFVLLIIFSVGILLTFHRMSYLILGLILTIYFLWIEKVALDKLILSGLLGICLLITTLLVYRNEILNSAVVQERFSDTVGGRAGYYNMVFDNIGYKPVFGYGGKENEVYFNSMLLITKEQNRATGTTGGIHSTYLSTMFYYGIPAFIFFTLFVLLSLTYFARLTSYHLFFAIPLIVTLFYAIGSLTNSYLFNRYLAIIYAIHLGIGIGAKQLKEYNPFQKEESLQLANKD